MHRNETKIDSKIDLVDKGSENETNVAVVLQLQRQKVVAMSEQRHFNPSLEKITKTSENQN